MNKPLLSLLLVFQISAFQVSELQAETFTAVSDSWTPFYSATPPHFGFIGQLVSAAMDTQGHDIEFRFMSWSSSLEHVSAGRLDILLGVWDTPERRNHMLYSHPFFKNKLKFVTIGEKNNKFDGLESLAGKKIGTIAGYAYGQEFLNDDSFSRVNSGSDLNNLRKLSSNKIDLAVIDEIALKALINSGRVSDERGFSISERSLSEGLMHITSGFLNPKHKRIIESFNAGLAIIKANGTYDKILRQYGIDSEGSTNSLPSE